MKWSIAQSLHSGTRPSQFRKIKGRIAVDDADILISLLAQIFLKPRGLTPMVQELDTLFQPDGDEQADANRGYMYEEVFPCMGGMRNVNIENGSAAFLKQVGQWHGSVSTNTGESYAGSAYAAQPSFK
jgi:hypothetical protein